MIDISHQLLIFCFVYDRDDLIAFLHIIGTCRFIDRRSAVQIFDNEFTQFFLFLSDDTDTTFNIMVKDKVIQNHSIKVCSQNTQHHCLLIIYHRCGKSHTHTGKRHCFSQFHVEIFVHNLCHNIQTTGGCISVKKNAQSYADDQGIAENIQFLTVGHGAKIRKYFLK